MAEPIAPKKFKFKDMEWSLCGSMGAQGDFTVKELWITSRRRVHRDVRADRAHRVTTTPRRSTRSAWTRRSCELVQTVAF